MFKVLVPAVLFVIILTVTPFLVKKKKNHNVQQYYKELPVCFGIGSYAFGRHSTTLLLLLHWSTRGFITEIESTDLVSTRVGKQLKVDGIIKAQGIGASVIQFWEMSGVECQVEDEDLVNRNQISFLKEIVAVLSVTACVASATNVTLSSTD